MRLSQPREPDFSPHDLTARAFAALDARLCRDIAAPVCVGVSGGGDSVALLALTCDWARARGRTVLALSVDHGLQAASAAWSEAVLAAAARFGAEGRVLRWEGDKPFTGLSAAAREARHRLLAQAAREAGAGVILLAHTADDLDEAAVMREEGSTLGDPREWAPSPAWPEGRGVFLLRPLLEARREELRALLRDRGLDWVEDPANDDPKYARSRARAALARGDGHGPRPGGRPSGTLRGVTDPGCRESGGGLVLDRAALRSAPPQIARRFLSAALLSAAGTSRPPRGERLDALLGRLKGFEAVTATLAGARIAADAHKIVLGREMPRGGLPPLELVPGAVSVWDGRWEISTSQPGLSVVPAQGRLARLSDRDRKEIQGLAPILRGSRPLLAGRDGAGAETRPVLALDTVRFRALALSRLRAACGAVAHEREIDHGVVAPGHGSPYIGFERS